MKDNSEEMMRLPLRNAASVIGTILCMCTAVTSATNTRIYIGNGCYWGRQHDIAIDVEVKSFGRTRSQVTAIGGYAGGDG